VKNFHFFNFLLKIRLFKIFLPKFSIFRIIFPETRNVSDELIDFMSRMFERDPFMRATTKDLKEHPWINKNRTPLSEIK
jgi:serine/threonine protein kinase